MVDLLQLVKDACTLYNLNYENPKLSSKLSQTQIQTKLTQAVSTLSQSPKKSIDTIFSTSLALASLFNLEFGAVEKLREEKEELQGSFYKGKYVIL